MPKPKVYDENILRESWVQRCWCWLWCWCGCCCCRSCDITGTVKMMAGGQIPSGWLLCNGQEVSKSTYSNLFTAIGYTYGHGSGTNFKVPNLAASFPRGMDINVALNPINVGQTGGNEQYSLTLAAANLPAHSHLLGSGALVSDENAHKHGVGTYSVSTNPHKHSVALTTGDGGFHKHSLPSKSLNGDTGSSGVAIAVSEETTSINTSEIAAHTHSLSGDTVETSLSPSVGGSSGSGDSHNHTISGATGDNTCSNPTLNIPTVPPFTKLLFIIKT